MTETTDFGKSLALYLNKYGVSGSHDFASILATSKHFTWPQIYVSLPDKRKYLLAFHLGRFERNGSRNLFKFWEVARPSQALARQFKK